MKNIILTILLFLILNNNCIAQKYTETYIKEANNTGVKWLQNINQKNYDRAYEILSLEIKEQSKTKENWIQLMSELMNEFGLIKDRKRTNIYFESEVSGQTGFFVFIEYECDYSNTQNHTEYLMLKQNDKMEWRISDYWYNFNNINNDKKK